MKRLSLFLTITLLSLSLYSPSGFSQDAPPKIEWSEWGPGVFERAKNENKPILLNLGASWCHWCHVMDQETYTDSGIIWMVNQMFIPVRVDSDRRPDINEKYNMGGWPSTVFLTDEGNVLVGATFLTADEMRYSLQKIIDLNKDKGEEVDKESNQKFVEFEAVLKEEIAFSKDEDFAPSFMDKILASILLSADAEFGGMGESEKTAIPEVTEFLFLMKEISADEKITKILNKYLDGLSNLYDSEGGGFFRYAANRDWSDIHYEKLLSNNSFLLRDFIWGISILKRAQDFSLVQKTLKYLEKDLFDPASNSFFGSQDSDLLIYTDGIDESEQAVRIPGKVYYSYSTQRRLELGAPDVDEHIYTDASAQAVFSLLEVAKKLGDADSGVTALKALDFLIQSSFVVGEGMHHMFPKREKSLLMLKDQVWMLKALVSAYEYTGSKKYWQKMLKLVKATEKSLGNKDGLFRDIAPVEGSVGYLRKREVPMTENSLMARIYLKLYRETGDAKYKQQARDILNFFAPRYQEYSIFASAYGSALIDWFYPAIEVKLVGSSKDSSYAELKKSVWKIPSNRLDVVDISDTRNPAALKELGLESLVGGKPKVVFCVEERCLRPEASPEKLTLLFELAQKIVRSKLVS